MFGWDRNPLRRRVDRVEAGVLAGLIMVFLIGAPVLVAGAGHWARAAGLRALRTQSTWSQVSATVPGAAPKSDQFPGELDTILMRGRWTAPDGRPRSGLIATSPGDAVGNTARIWVSRSGSPTGAPRGRSELLGWTPIAEVGTALVVAFICFLAVRLQRWLFERSRLTRWHRAWRAQGPRWTGQRLLPPSLRSSPRTGDAGHVMSGQSDLHDGSADRGVPREATMSLPAGERGRLRVMGRLPSSSDSRLVPLFSMRHH
jgi:hypothetical protein